jgi:hypothetical protein
MEDHVKEKHPTTTTKRLPLGFFIEILRSLESDQVDRIVLRLGEFVILTPRWPIVNQCRRYSFAKDSHQPLRRSFCNIVDRSDGHPY